MAREWIVGSALVALGLAAGGCESSSPALGRNQLLQDPELLALIARNGGQPAGGARGQKPDAPARPVSFLDVPPERPADANGGQPAATICAIVNSQAILDEEVRASAYAELLRASFLPEPERSRRTAEVFKAALDRIIEREVVLQDAFDKLRGNDKGGERFINRLKEAAGKEFDHQVLAKVRSAGSLKSDEEVKRYFADQGVSLANVRRQWERNFMEFEYLRQRVLPLLETRVNHQAMVDYYEKHPEEFQIADGVRWQDLFVAAASAKYASRAEARARAESLAEQARKGADFAKLVKEHDDGDSSLRDGEGVGRKRGEIRPAEAEAALFSLKDGQVGPVVELPTGFHVVKLVHRDFAGQLPFDEKVQKQIRDKLRNELFQREIQLIVKQLKRKAVIEYARKVG